MPDNVNEMLSKFIRATESLCKAIENEDMAEIEALINQREEIIKNCPNITEKYSIQKNDQIEIDKLLSLDRVANDMLNDLKSSLQEKLISSSKQLSGLIGYNKMQHDLSSGHIINNKR
jgi:hypothetical protein